MSPDVSQPEFRPATSADAELLLDFMHDYYLFDGHRYERDPARTALLGLLNNPAFGLAWLVLDSGTPVGYIVLCFGYSLEYLGRDAFIDEFYLTKSHRGRGRGRKTPSRMYIDRVSVALCGADTLVRRRCCCSCFCFCLAFAFALAFAFDPFFAGQALRDFQQKEQPQQQEQQQRTRMSAPQLYLQ